MHKLTGILMAVVVACTTLLVAGTAQAHFIWLAPEQEDGNTVVQVYFGEDASPDDPDLLDRLDGLVVRQVLPGIEPQLLKLEREGDSLHAHVGEETAGKALFIATHDYGVLDRGDAVFRLVYYAKGGSAAGHTAWTTIDCSDQLALDVVPKIEGDTIRVQVRFRGRPIEGAEVRATGPGMDDFAGTTDIDGHTSFTLAEPGRYSIRARQIENAGGEVDGKSYKEVRHYSTVSVETPARSPATAGLKLPALPQSVTSFGAAICDGWLYLYGGHTGSAHSYSMEEQGRELQRASLEGGEWETVAEGPPLQGLALVAHRGKLYRIGGFTAKNAEGEDHDLWSQDSVATFDPDTNQWTDLPPLPEPRSSFDAAVVGDTIYVVGGWALAGDTDSVWHETAWAVDLAADRLEWKPLPTAPFHRRALAAAAHDGKLYVIGGMQQEGGPTTKVDVYDPKTHTWTDGPALVGADDNQDRGDMTGFGAAAFATGGRLYVSTIKGDLQRLTEDSTRWEIVGQTPTARFFHRMLPLDDNRLVIAGGANMQIGKFEQIDILPVD